jgi:hypothetical protein
MCARTRQWDDDLHIRATKLYFTRAIFTKRVVVDQNSFILQKPKINIFRYFRVGRS